MLYLITHASKKDEKLLKQAIELSGSKGKLIIIPYAVEFERKKEESIKDLLLHGKHSKVLDSSKTNKMKKALPHTIAICAYDANADVSKFWEVFDKLKCRKYTIVSPDFSEDAYAVIYKDIITDKKMIAVKEPGEIIETTILEEPVKKTKKFCDMLVVYTEKRVYHLL